LRVLLPDQEGRFAIVTNVGLKDAVDAFGATDERAKADGEVVAS
jgi:hypothetical protein